MEVCCVFLKCFQHFTSHQILLKIYFILFDFSLVLLSNTCNSTIILPYLNFSPTHNSLKYIGQNNNDGPKKEQIEDTKKSDEVLFYVLAGIISVILICIFAVILILKKYQIKEEKEYKKDNCEDPLEDFDIIDITDQDLMVNPEVKNDVTLPTFYKVCIF